MHSASIETGDLIGPASHGGETPPADASNRRVSSDSVRSGDRRFCVKRALPGSGRCGLGGAGRTQCGRGGVHALSRAAARRSARARRTRRPAGSRWTIARGPSVVEDPAWPGWKWISPRRSGAISQSYARAQPTNIQPRSPMTTFEASDRPARDRPHPGTARFVRS